jgi:hypothetical protein
MKLPLFPLAVAAALVAAPAYAHDEDSLKSAPPGEPYVRVSDVLPRARASGRVKPGRFAHPV